MNGPNLVETPFFRQIYAHASVRRYLDRPVPLAIVEAIVAAGQRSSTSSNLQMFSVVAVADPDKRARLAELCGNQAHIAQAPVFLAWCADLSRLERASELRGYTQVSEYAENFLLAAVDTAIAMQTATLAAESLGLGMCYIGAIRNHPLDVIELLELPPLVFPISGMTLGWPEGEHKPRPRLPLEAVLHWERYDASDEAGAVEKLRPCHGRNRTSTPAGRWPCRETRGRWKTTAGASTPPGASRSQSESTCARRWQCRDLS